MRVMRACARGDIGVSGGGGGGDIGVIGVSAVAPQVRQKSAASAVEQIYIPETLLAENEVGAGESPEGHEGGGGCGLKILWTTPFYSTLRNYWHQGRRSFEPPRAFISRISHSMVALGASKALGAEARHFLAKSSLDRSLVLPRPAYLAHIGMQITRTATM